MNEFQLNSQFLNHLIKYCFSVYPCGNLNVDLNQKLNEIQNNHLIVTIKK